MVSGSFVFSCALHRSWKANSPKVNFLSFYKLTPGGCYSNCKVSIMSCVNKPDSQCWGRASPQKREGGGIWWAWKAVLEESRKPCKTSAHLLSPTDPSLLLSSHLLTSHQAKKRDKRCRRVACRGLPLTLRDWRPYDWKWNLNIYPEP